MDGETKSGRLTYQLGRPHAWKGGIAGQPYLETVSLTAANMCQGDWFCAFLDLAGEFGKGSAR